MVKEIPNIILFSGVFISISVANVQLTTSSIVNGSQISICNSTITYSCQIKSYTLMYFLIDDMKVATCTGLVCTQFQAMPSNADFIYNTTAGIFNLTFNNINRTDTGKVIKCSDGTSTNDKEIIQNVKDYTVLFEEVSGQTGSEIKIVTGCISNTTKLSFFWNTFQANSSNVRKYTGKTETMPPDTLSCLHDPVCGSSESVRYGNIMSITETGGSKNYIQSIVVFKEAGISYSVKMNSKRMYAISDKEQTISTIVKALIVSVGCIWLIAVGFIIIYCKKFSEVCTELPVQFTETLTDQKVKEKDTLTLSCKLNKENIPVKWLKNDIEIGPNKRTKVLVDQYQHQLIITDVSLCDKGTYVCVCGNVSINCTIGVEELPVQFTETLTDQKVTEKDTLTLSCKLNKENRPVKWLKNDMEIGPNKRTKVLVDQYQHQLIITDVSLGDEGTYVCVCGNVSINCTIMVEELPVQFTETLTDKKVKEKDTLTLSCKLNKDNIPVKWLKNDMEIGPNKKTKVLIDQYKHQLIITQATSDDVGTYSCVCGNVSTNGNIVVEE